MYMERGWGATVGRGVSLGVRFWGYTPPHVFVKSEEIVWNVGDAERRFSRVNKALGLKGLRRCVIAVLCGARVMLQGSMD